MIRNKLKELMDERGLKATRIANDIDNLSRNTINSTVSNSGKMIQFETVNSLCQYLGVTPQEFFEYLPFDVSVSISGDEQPVVPDSIEEASANDTYIEPFYLDLYLTKTSNNYSTGEIKKTFELSIISENKISFHYSEIQDDDYSFYMDVPNLKVILGNPPIKDSMKSQKESFFKFWNDDLTAGFQKVIQEKISRAFYDYLSKFQSDNQYITLPPSIPISFRFDDFDSDYSKLNCGIVMKHSLISNLSDDELPFWGVLKLMWVSLKADCLWDNMNINFYE